LKNITSTMSFAVIEPMNALATVRVFETRPIVQARRTTPAPRPVSALPSRFGATNDAGRSSLDGHREDGGRLRERSDGRIGARWSSSFRVELRVATKRRAIGDGLVEPLLVLHELDDRRQRGAPSGLARARIDSQDVRLSAADARRVRTRSRASRTAVSRWRVRIDFSRAIGWLPLRAGVGRGCARA
jgi:hypothetical protein